MLHGFDLHMPLDTIIKPNCESPDCYTIDDFCSIIIWQWQAISKIILERMHAAQECNAKQGNQSCAEHKYAEGDLILVAQEPAVGKLLKFVCSWAGPYCLLHLAKYATKLQHLYNSTNKKTIAIWHLEAYHNAFNDPLDLPDSYFMVNRIVEEHVCAMAAGQCAVSCTGLSTSWTVTAGCTKMTSP